MPKQVGLKHVALKQAAIVGAMIAAAPVVTAPAEAQIDSVRLGAMKHNICVIDCKNADKEDGFQVVGELRFASPDFLKVIGSPHPYVMASVNTAGDTSYAGFGLEYDFEFADTWHFEPGFGLVWHDGAVRNKFPNGTIAAQEYDDTHVLLGSRDLFRTNLALTKDFSDAFAGQLIYEHLSHGQVLGKGRNQGLDEIGVRLVWRFQ